jgi:hypothetical protein
MNVRGFPCIGSRQKPQRTVIKNPATWAVVLIDDNHAGRDEYTNAAKEASGNKNYEPMQTNCRRVYDRNGRSGTVSAAASVDGLENPEVRQGPSTHEARFC